MGADAPCSSWRGGFSNDKGSHSNEVSDVRHYHGEIPDSAEIDPSPSPFIRWLVVDQAKAQRDGAGIGDCESLVKE